MSLRSTHLTAVGALGAAGLLVAITAAPSGAIGPVTANPTYSCFNGAVTATVQYSFAPPTSTSLVAGQKEQLAGSATVTLPGGATHLMLGLGWDSFTGKVTAPVPTKTLGLNLSVPLTPVGTPPGQDLTNTTAIGTGNATMDYPAAGTSLLKAGNFTATLQGYKSGTKVGKPVALTCTAPTGTTSELKDSTSTAVSVKVVKDASTTTATAKYLAAKHQAKSTAKVHGTKYGLPGTGSVKFTLRKGTHTIKTMTGKLSKGMAAVTFKGVSAKGKYTIAATYAGNAGLKASSSKRMPFTVK